ncbi:hypothetical protein O5O45_31610 [Hahella aquimaris]|uniref:hypothetical protein n=1 Tax=Hahella sp. HNIBRBA332 TaxID=3015983 RepID=UPI00273CA7EC|nr:hypothetical protein [Hahella sp. HNIBRBA332]WLQ14267.1 hypothetical protein O5O45_31610 [Hahella sp. HNIBRBA332]
METPDESEVELLCDWMQSNLFHFSTKTINSNASSGGVRLTSAHAINLPYISVRTLLAEGKEIGLDYVGNASVHAGKFKRIRQLRLEAPGPSTDTESARQRIAESYKLATQSFLEDGTDSISPRLRQILIPMESDYVSLTPLGSAGLCEYISTISRCRDDIRKQQEKEYENSSGGQKKRTTIRYDARVNSFSIGGSNPQNAGGRVRSIRPFVFSDVPRTTPNTRLAFRLFYKGFKPFIPKIMVSSYATWLLSRVKEGSMINARLQEEERSLIKALLSAMEKQADKARRVLNAYQKDLPSIQKNLENENSYFLSNGWLDPTKRSPYWRKERAKWLVGQLRESKLEDKRTGDIVGLGLSPADQHRLIKLIEGM